jgi:hypothetical protein
MKTLNLCVCAFLFVVMACSGGSTNGPEVYPNDDLDADVIEVDAVPEVDFGEVPETTDEVEVTADSSETSETETGETETEVEVEVPDYCTSHSECDEQGPCFVGACQYGHCVYTAKCDGECVEGVCQSADCQTDIQCNDANACTIDTCTNGTCANVAIPNCCQTANDCTDENPCTKAFCHDNECTFGPDNDATCVAGGLPGKCEGSYCWNDTPEGMCFDNNPCTDDSLSEGQCVHFMLCMDGNPCTTDFCYPIPNDQGSDHTCVFELLIECCLTNADCDDGKPCSEDKCVNGVCENSMCQVDECSVSEDCDDGDACTAEVCVGGTCLSQSIPNCCGADADCDDGDPCSEDLCVNGVCENSVCQIDECTKPGDCDDGNPCTDETCESGTCSSVDTCIYSALGKAYKTCTSDLDCAAPNMVSNDEFGQFCVDSGEEDGSLKLCQPCVQESVTEDVGCSSSEMCVWGLSGTGDYLFSVFNCEPIVCTENEDCDDGNPCTKDTCSQLYCLHTDKPHCKNCNQNSQCESNFWCNNSGGGVYVQYETCEPDGSCQLDYWASTISEATYGCQNPLSCSSDADCPLDGTCMISSCYYGNPMPDFTYPECNADSSCPYGTCNMTTGTCIEHECYSVDNADGTISTKLCAAGQACVNNTCQNVTAFQCVQNEDCEGILEQSYCTYRVEDELSYCSQCKPDKWVSQESHDLGCTTDVPYCQWNGGFYQCTECLEHAECAPGHFCDEGTCAPFLNNVVCTATTTSDYTEVVFMFGVDEAEFVELNNPDAYWVVSPATLCQWGEPKAKFNLRDIQDNWGNGEYLAPGSSNGSLSCNYEFTVVPDAEYGDQGLQVLTFPSISCANP